MSGAGCLRSWLEFKVTGDILDWGVGGVGTWSWVWGVAQAVGARPAVTGPTLPGAWSDGRRWSLPTHLASLGEPVGCQTSDACISNVTDLLPAQYSIL